MDDAEIQDIAKLLWEAPFGVISLDLEEDPETPKYVVMLMAGKLDSIIDHLS